MERINEKRISISIFKMLEPSAGEYSPVSSREERWCCNNRKMVYVLFVLDFFVVLGSLIGGIFLVTSGISSGVSAIVIMLGIFLLLLAIGGIIVMWKIYSKVKNTDFLVG